MRTSTKALLALNFSLAAAAGACDDDLAADAGGGGADDAVAFRCLPPDCTTNSPFVGDYPFSNIRTRQSTSANTPIAGVSAYVEWSMGQLQRANNTWMTFDFLAPTPEGRLYAYNSATNTREFIDQGQQAFFKVSIADFSVNPVTVQHYPLWIKAAASTTPTAGFTTWKYTIGVQATQPSVDFPSLGGPEVVPPVLGPNPWTGTYFSLCPVSEEETGEALILQHAELVFAEDSAWLVDGYKEGPEDVEEPSNAVIACQGHALSKPQEFLGVTPNSYEDEEHPASRHYGLANYNALVNAYRAFYDGESRTELGTPVFFKDFAHSPAWFDQTTSAYLPATPPAVGSWQFVLESVYADHEGASCYYNDTNSPSGAHRLYNPPAGNANLPGWGSMTSCGATQSSWDDFGPVGAFVLQNILPGGGIGS